MVFVTAYTETSSGRTVTLSAAFNGATGRQKPVSLYTGPGRSSGGWTVGAAGNRRRCGPDSAGGDLAKRSRGFCEAVQNGGDTAVFAELIALQQQVQQMAARVEQMAAQVQQVAERIEQLGQRIR